jgi:methylated-DNA-protein-cysteine methyltransferase-like protein
MTGKYMTPKNRLQYYNRVWDMVRRIPSGKVATYGKIASLVEPPEGLDPATYHAVGARWVGGAMKTCPEDVPWQRVINAQGKISLQGEAAVHQHTLLEAEGVRFDSKNRVDLNKYQWMANGEDRTQLELPM